MKLRYATMVFFAVCITVSAQTTNTVLWQAERVHYTLGETTPYYAWIIKPSEDGATNGHSFKVVIDGIFRADPSPVVKHVYLGASHRKGLLQEEVIRQLKDTVVIKRYPTRHDSNGRMYLDGTTNALSQTMCQLVYKAILNTSIVKDMNKILTKHGLRIDTVQTEKLFIASEKGIFRWDAIGWLIIGTAEPSVRGDGKPAPQP